MQSHSNVSEDQESCSQSSEFTQGSELHPIPVSVEVSDKQHDQNPSAPTRKNTSPVQVKRKESQSIEDRRSPKAKKSVASDRKNDLQLPRQTEVDKEEETSPSPTSARDKSADGFVMTINRNDIKTEETGHWIIQTNVTGEFRNPFEFDMGIHMRVENRNKQTIKRQTNKTTKTRLRPRRGDGEEGGGGGEVTPIISGKCVPQMVLNLNPDRI